MKKLSIVLSIVLVMAVGGFAGPTLMGAEGFIAMPRVDTAYTTRIGLGVKYLSWDTFNFGLNVVPLKRFEIGLGIDIGSGATPISPLFANVKFQIAPVAAIGFMSEIPLNTSQTFKGTLYLAFEGVFTTPVLGSGNATFGFGYTFGGGDNINFFIGMQQTLFIKQFKLIMDFANFSYRQNSGPQNHQDINRGVLNLGLRLEALSWLSFEVSGLDLMDNTRGLMLGVNVYFQLGLGRR